MSTIDQIPLQFRQRVGAGNHREFGSHLTYKGNRKDTRFGWLRLTPAYSLTLVDELLDDVREGGMVLDPFCGTGTTSLVCAMRGMDAVTTDINPFLIWLTKAKAANYSTEDLEQFSERAVEVAQAIKTTTGSAPEWVPPIHQIDKWWDEVTLHALGRAMATIKRGDTDSPANDLLRLAFCRVTIERASVSFGHQSMSFKEKIAEELQLPAETRLSMVLDNWHEAALSFAGAAASTDVPREPGALLLDARNLREGIPNDSIARVITSPPYPNRMSYIRELRPYLYWLGYLKDGKEAGELDWTAIGGTWGTATSRAGKWEPTDDRVIGYEPFLGIISQIAAAHPKNGVLLSRYVHKYFFDMVQHVDHLFDVMEPGATAHYIVGNSKFYDVMLPVQDIYAGMFERRGFEDISVRAFRKRSSKKELFEYVVEARKPL